MNSYKCSAIFALVVALSSSFIGCSNIDHILPENFGEEIVGNSDPTPSSSGLFESGEERNDESDVILNIPKIDFVLEKPDAPSEGLIYEMSEEENSYFCVGVGTCKDQCVLIPETYDSLPVIGVRFPKLENDLATEVPWDNGCVKAIFLPESAREIGIHAFSKSENLLKVEIPEGVTEIGISAFADCTGLTEVHIPKSVSRISDSAFSGCENLAQIEIDDGLTHIGNAAFSGCSSLETVILPSTVASLGDSPFGACGQLSSIIVGPGNTAYHSEDGILFTGDLKNLIFCPCAKSGSISIPQGVCNIERGAFTGCAKISSISLPDGLLTIGDMAFSGCKSLVNIDLPNGLTSIGYGAFNSCAISQITIPDSVTEIGSGAFSYCNALKYINISNGLTYNGDLGLNHCENLEEISVTNDNPAYACINGVLFSKDISELVTYPSNKKGDVYAIPDGVTTVYQDAFFRNENLKKLLIPSSVKKLGSTDEDTYYCSSIVNASGLTEIVVDENNVYFSAREGVLFNKDATEILIYPQDKNDFDRYDIPHGVQKIAHSCFLNCKLGEIGIPDSVQIIGSGAIRSNTLIRLTIPASVYKIGDGAFACEKLCEITIMGTHVELGQHVFEYCSEDLIIHCIESGTVHWYAQENGIKYDFLR